MLLPKDIEAVVGHFSNLPGIGPKTASRLALALLKMDTLVVEDFANSLVKLKKNISKCRICANLCNGELCGVCLDKKRDEAKIMLVEDVLDLMAFERTEQYSGRYHVLGGLLSPVQGIGPEDLNIGSLLKRLSELSGGVELIIATSPNLEGEATAIYIQNQLSRYQNISISRIARGVPTGADLDYTDKLTLLRALENRTSM